MNLKRSCICLLSILLFCGLKSSAQSIKHDTLWIHLSQDTTLLPNTETLTDFEILGSRDSADYQLIWGPPRIVSRFRDSIQVVVKPLNFPPLTFANKDTSLITSGASQGFEPYVIRPRNGDPLDDQSQLNRSGSIARGIVVGNNQDLSVNSALNLQLSGKITDDISVLASITDDNLPIQPDGNTQQLQDFDQIFVKLYNERSSLLAGDFQIREEQHFLRFQKRARGALIETMLAGKPGSGSDSIQVQASAAISKGKFARNIIQGVEGNQGPYRLIGAENELFVIVLAGTERVFIDGQLLERGRDYDYVIDYNNAEITFMPKRRITKDRRIVVEFQYSDRNYARTMVQSNIRGKEGNLEWIVSGYSEQDSRNQPLQQTLGAIDRNLLADVGDDLFQAFRQGIDSTGFDEGAVMYALVDSLGYDSVLVQSSNQELAVYTARFSFVGQGNGDYIEAGFNANGRVFQWVAPEVVNGTLVPQGSWAPIQLLVSPKLNQMASGEAVWKYKDKSKIRFGASITRNDQNTFSDLDSGDDQGLGGFFDWQHTKPMKNEWELIGNLSHEYVSQHFQPIERFRSVEFDRIWNIRNLNLLSDQQLSAAGISIAKAKTDLYQVKASSFLYGSGFTGYQGAFNVFRQRKRSQVKFSSSLTDTEGLVKTTFYEHNSDVKVFIKGIQLQYTDDFETNTNGNPSDVLNRGYEFHEWKTSLGSRDTLKNQWNVFYSERIDQFADSTAIVQRAARAREYGAFIGVNSIKNQNISLRLSQRELNILRDDLVNQEPDESLLGRLEHRMNLWRGAVQSNLFVEIGSGLEQQREFIYLEVPPGQGAYVWNDYNGDGIRDLEEFEIAPFALEANFIRSWVPSSQYVRTYSNQFSETLTLQPARVWQSEKGWKKLLSRFSNTTAYRVERKTNDFDGADRFNPFATTIADESLLSLLHSLRNSLGFNRTSTIFSADYTFQDQRNKNLLANGFESRSNVFHELGFKFQIAKGVSFLASNSVGTRRTSSDFLTGRNYTIDYQSTEPEIQYQPSTRYRIAAKARYVAKQNDEDLGGENATIQDIGLEAKISDPGKGLIQAEVHWVEIAYDGDTNSALGFEMLEALQVGRNITWTASVQRTIGKNLQLNLTYNGRTSEENPTVHTGGMQVRAFF